MGVINDSKKGALKDSAYGIVKAAELYVTQNLISSQTVKNQVIDNLESDTILEYKGTKPSCGMIIMLSNGKTYLQISDGKTVATKNYLKDDIELEDGNCNDVKQTIANIKKPVQDGLVINYDGKVAPVTIDGKLIWKDQSGNGNDGELMGFTGNDFYKDNGIKFNGSNYIKSVEKNVQKLTLEAVYDFYEYPPDTIFDNHNVIFGNIESGGYALELYAQSKKNMLLINVNGTYDYASFEEQGEAKINQNNYVSASYDNSQIVLFENGIKYAKQKTGAIKDTTNKTILMLGANPYGSLADSYSKLKGTIYTARFYDRALTDEEKYHNYVSDQLNYGI